MRLYKFKMLLPVFIFAACSGPGNISSTSPDATIAELRKNISYLADDKLEGRRTGTPCELLAMNYIINQFKQAGLSPKGSQNYIQAFEVNDGKVMDKTVALAINGNKTETGFFIFPFSVDTVVNATVPLRSQDAGDPWIFDLKTILEENKNNPHFDLADYVYKNSKKAIDRGADAVVLYNSSAIDDKLVFNGKDKSPMLNGVVLYLSRADAQKYFNNGADSVTIQIVSKLDEKKRTGHNVVGYIDNGAATTIVLGAHYDHLGYGEDGNSRNTSHEAAIHNGADDNASGTAALIELARQLKKSKATNNNYLFIAFSGEELGLYGSKYFTDHPTIDLKAVNYMINMDMVGRLNDSTKVLTIGGYGTSPTWGKVIEKEYFATKHDIKKQAPSLVIKIDSSGTGPSDHTSFYRKDIPVLFYFTGLHTDYHKPSDDADKINYTGEQTIIAHIMQLIEKLNKEPRLTFAKTRETQTTTSARFSVSMGIMPDYTFAGTGVKADGVSDGKPAQKAGLQAGDIIIELGGYHISSMESYMQTLGKFKKGETVKVKYIRGGKTLETSVSF